MTKNKNRITEEGLEYTVKTFRYNYFKCIGVTLFPSSIAFIATFKGESDIQDMLFETWLGMILSNKIVISSGNILTQEQEDLLRKVSPLSDPFLTVENIESKYLVQTLFIIINTLLQQGSTLKSLEWIE